MFITVPFIWGEHEPPFDFRRFTSFGIKQLIEDEESLEIKRFEKVLHGVDAIESLIGSEITHAKKRNKIVEYFVRAVARIAFRIIKKFYLLERIYQNNLIIVKKQGEN